MTAVVAQTSTTGMSPVAEGVARVHASIDGLAAMQVGGVSGRDVAEVDRAMSRLAAVKLSMVAAAHQQGAARRAGMTSTSAWLAASTRSWGARAAADVALATALADSLPATREALASGALSAEHAAVIAGTAARLPAALTDDERCRVEAALVAQARRVDPARLRRSARRALEAAERSAEEALEHEDTELRGEEDRARWRTRLTLHDNLDGTVTGHFTVPTLAGSILRKVIQQMVSPRRHPGAQGRGNDQGDASGGAPASAFGLTRARVDGSPAETMPSLLRGAARASWAADHPRDWAHLSGTAFVELLEHLPTDRLSGKVAATVVVTIDHDRLRDQVGAARLDTGADLSAAEARRLACSAGVLPAVVGGGSLPLDLGRTRRFFSESQRVALATAYERCAAEHCDRPYAWTELHHQDPWGGGGPTDLHLAVPLCGPDHQRAHDPRYEHHIATDGVGRKTVRFHLRA